jgi:2-hydroxychromene-2-carboxylate isomerase
MTDSDMTHRSLSTDRPTSVDFHFDVMCPFAYQTSLWIREVRALTGLEINWRFFSLEEVNRVEGKKHPWERDWSYGWSMMRVGALLRRIDPSALDRWYACAGAALHEHGNKPHDPDVARALLRQIDLDPDLVQRAIDDPTTNDEIHSEHQRVIDAGGFGVPTLFFGEHCLFGPVLIDPPTGDDALALWDLVVGWLRFPHLFELQRPKNRDHLRAITRSLQPYLSGRDWVSMNRGEVIEFPGPTAR